MTGYTIYHQDIPEFVVPGKPLGRNIHFDSRSLAYPWPATSQILASVTHRRHTAILNQGEVSSCTGNAETGALGTDPFFATLPLNTPLDEGEAVSLYSAAEIIDGDGPYPPQDNGSCGLSVCKAAQHAGLISGYLHCLSLSAVLDALQARPVIVGVSWYTSFDSPSASGLISIVPGATVRGGHEFVLRGVDVAAQTVLADNSWGADWGVAGSFSLSWATLERLLGEGGDCTVSVPLTEPAPVPVPVPDPPLPVVPGDTDPDDVALSAALHPWAFDYHVGGNAQAARAAQAWLSAKGFTT